MEQWEFQSLVYVCSRNWDKDYTHDGYCGLIVFTMDN